MILVMCELIDNVSGSLGGDRDGADNTIDNGLNKVIVGVKNRSKAMCSQPFQGWSWNKPYSMPPHHNANFQPDSKVGINVRLDCTLEIYTIPPVTELVKYLFI